MTGSQAVKGGTHRACGGTHARQVFKADGLPADSSGGRSMTFGRPGTRKPENTSARSHQRMDAAAAMTPKEASEALGVVPLGPGEKTPTTSSWSVRLTQVRCVTCFQAPPPPSTLVRDSTTRESGGTADAPDLGSGARKGVGVRLSPLAPLLTCGSSFLNSRTRWSRRPSCSHLLTRPAGARRDPVPHESASHQSGATTVALGCILPQESRGPRRPMRRKESRALGVDHAVDVTGWARASRGAVGDPSDLRAGRGSRKPGRSPHRCCPGLRNSCYASGDSGSGTNPRSRSSR
jgi:hypothetical protein